MSYKADELFLEADRLIGIDSIAEARELLNKIVDEYPDYGRAHNHLGWVNEHRLRYFARAEEHYKAALHFSPDYPAVWINYTYFLGHLGRYDELLEHLKKAQKVQGVSQSFICNETASVWEMKGEYDKAIEFYKEAIKSSQNDENIERYETAINRVSKKKEL